MKTFLVVLSLLILFPTTTRASDVDVEVALALAASKRKRVEVPDVKPAPTPDPVEPQVEQPKELYEYRLYGNRWYLVPANPKPFSSSLSPCPSGQCPSLK